MDQFWTWGDDFSVKFRGILLVLKHFQYSKQAHGGPEDLKQSRPKKLEKSNKSISRNFYGPVSIFCNFKNDQKSLCELEKSLKHLKMQFHENFHLISQVFCLDFFKFSGLL